MVILVAALLCSSCAPLPAPEPLIGQCSASDGDTIRCGDERIRLLGIDAPEKAGQCRAGRICTNGDPVASAESLRVMLARGGLQIRRVGRDRYGRTLALVSAGGVDLSCYQLARGQAVYVRRWDDRRALARTCPAALSHPE